MHKNALLKKKLKNCRNVEGSTPKPPLTSGSPKLLLSSPVSYFLEGVCSANVITVKKEQKELRSSNNVPLLPLISNFKL